MYVCFHIFYSLIVKATFLHKRVIKKNKFLIALDTNALDRSNNHSPRGHLFPPNLRSMTGAHCTECKRKIKAIAVCAC